MKVWYKRTILLVDKYKPDLIYFDGHLPGTSNGMTYGLDFAAHFYNNSIKNHNGKLEAVINLKFAPDKRGYVFEIERGQAETLQDLPWQTDTDLSGGWFYRKTEPQFTTDVLVGNLIDIVDIPLHSTPRFRYKVRHPFRSKVHQCSAGKYTDYSGAKYTTLLNGQYFWRSDIPT